MTEDDVAAVMQFVRDELLADPQTEIAPSTPLISKGLVDSLGAVRLAAFIEERFNIRFDDVEIRAGVAESVDSILALVHKKR